MIKYEVKEIHKHHSQMKLVVDEEDQDQAAPTSGTQINQQNIF